MSELSAFLARIPPDADLDKPGAFLKSGWSCPRWLHMESAFRDACFKLNLTIVTLEIEKHWLTEDARFKVSGRGRDIVSFSKWFMGAIDEYNKDTTS